ncbi:GD14571 [Drosophila simulans]|uniref:GD14571 n=1 Tax=Drosophila simulans TaxID=7240 RepID=B4QLP6_DROSI|nr:GD14571 [Drosophila simulans]
MGSRNAAANDRSMLLTGMHGSIMAPVSKVFEPVSSTTMAVGRMGTAFCCPVATAGDATETFGRR